LQAEIEVSRSRLQERPAFSWPDAFLQLRKGKAVAFAGVREDEPSHLLLEKVYDE
jgi:hypothetical protein